MTQSRKKFFFIPQVILAKWALYSAFVVLPTTLNAAEAPLQLAVARGETKLVEGRPQIFSLEAASAPIVPLSPDLKAKSPLLGKIRFFGRDVWLAVPSKNEVPHHVVIDSNFNGRLENTDLQAELFAAKAVADSLIFKSNPLKLALRPDVQVDAKADYTARIEVSRVTHWTLDGVETRWQGAFRSIGWRTGTLNWQGKSVTVGVQDDNSNGRFDDPFQLQPQSPGDLMLFDWNGDGFFRGSREVLRGCRYLFADNQLCSLAVASGGTRLDMLPISSGSGQLQTDVGVRELHMASNHGLLVAPVQNGLVRLPPGDHWVLQWIAKAIALDGREWEMKAASAKPPQIKIGATLQKIALMAPLSPILSADKQQDGLRFSLVIAAKNNHTILRLAPVGQEMTPQLRLFDPQGNPIARLKLKLEDKANFGLFWKPPTDAPPILHARLELHCGPFAVDELPDWEFAVPTTVAA